MKHTLKRILSLLLAVVMLVSLLCTTAFAKDDTFRYVALGDSTTMGYKLNDYPEESFTHNLPSSQYGIYSQMDAYLQQSMPDTKVQSTDLTMVGMRPAELRAILDEDYFNRIAPDYDEATQTLSKDNYCAEKLFWYLYGGDQRRTQEIGGKSSAYLTYNNIRNTYTEALADADLITYGLLMSDVSGYFGYRFINSGSDLYDNDSYAQLMRDEGRPAVAKGAEALRTAGEKLLGGLGLPMDTVNGYLDALLYTYANFCICFSETMDWIYENNPDVQVVVISPYNSMDGLIFEVADGISIDMGKVWNLLIGSLTEYVVDFDSHNKQYKLADLNNGIEMVYGAIQQGKLTDEAYANIKSWLLDNAYGDIANAGDTLERNPYNDALILENFAKAISYTSMNISAAMNMDDSFAISRAVRGVGSDEDYAKLNMVLRLNWMSAIGCHPSAVGYQQEFAAVKTAYENAYHTGENAYVTRLVTNTVSFLDNSVKAVFGSKTAAAQVQKTLRSVFSPVLRISLK